MNESKIPRTITKAGSISGRTPPSRDMQNKQSQLKSRLASPSVRSGSKSKGKYSPATSYTVSVTVQRTPAVIRQYLEAEGSFQENNLNKANKPNDTQKMLQQLKQRYGVTPKIKQQSQQEKCAIQRDITDSVENQETPLKSIALECKRTENGNINRSEKELSNCDCTINKTMCDQVPGERIHVKNAKMQTTIQDDHNHNTSFSVKPSNWKPEGARRLPLILQITLILGIMGITFLTSECLTGNVYKHLKLLFPKGSVNHEGLFSVYTQGGISEDLKTERDISSNNINEKPTKKDSLMEKGIASFPRKEFGIGRHKTNLLSVDLRMDERAEKVVTRKASVETKAAMDNDNEKFKEKASQAQRADFIHKNERYRKKKLQRKLNNDEGESYTLAVVARNDNANTDLNTERSSYLAEIKCGNLESQWKFEHNNLSSSENYSADRTNQRSVFSFNFPTLIMMSIFAVSSIFGVIILHKKCKFRNWEQNEEAYYEEQIQKEAFRTYHSDFSDIDHDTNLENEEEPTYGRQLDLRRNDRVTKPLQSHSKKLSPKAVACNTGLYEGVELANIPGTPKVKMQSVRRSRRISNIRKQQEDLNQDFPRDLVIDKEQFVQQY